MLEAALNRHAMEWLQLPIPFQLLTGNAHGRRVAELLIDGAARIFRPYVPQDPIAELVACLGKVINVATKRNEVLHGVWGVITESTGMSAGEPSDLGIAFRRRGAAISGFPADAASIEQTASQIDAVRLELNRIFFRILRPGLGPHRAAD